MRSTILALDWQAYNQNGQFLRSKDLMTTLFKILNTTLDTISSAHLMPLNIQYRSVSRNFEWNFTDLKTRLYLAVFRTYRLDIQSSF